MIPAMNPHVNFASGKPRSIVEPPFESQAPTIPIDLLDIEGVATWIKKLGFLRCW